MGIKVTFVITRKARGKLNFKIKKKKVASCWFHDDDTFGSTSHKAQFAAAAAAKSLQSCPTLCDPLDAAHQAPLSLGFSRQEHWSELQSPVYLQTTQWHGPITFIRWENLREIPVVWNQELLWKIYESVSVWPNLKDKWEPDDLSVVRTLQDRRVIWAKTGMPLRCLPHLQELVFKVGQTWEPLRSAPGNLAANYSSLFHTVLTD